MRGFVAFALALLSQTAAQEMNTKIVKLFELARHGARAPEPGKSDPTFSFLESPQCCNQFNYSRVWPMGSGGLTNVGALQHQANGRALRARYANATAMPQIYTPGQVALFVAPDCQRCQDSLLNQTIGLFGNSTSIPESQLSSNAFWWSQKSTCLPVTLNVFENVDSTTYAQFSTGARATLLGACINSTLNAVNGTCTNLTASNGGLVQNFGIPYCGDNVFSSWYYNTSDGSGTGNELPKWFREDQLKACMDSINVGRYYTIYHNASQPTWKNNSLPAGSQLMIGNLLQTVSLFFSDNATFAQGAPPNSNFVFPKGINLAGGTEEPTTFVLAVGHETQVASLLTALSAFGDFNFLQPPFASLVMLELHQDVLNATGLYVRALYRFQLWNQKQPQTDILPLSFCPSASVTNGYLCPLEQFVDAMKPMYISGPIAEKEVCDSYTRTKTSTMTVTRTATFTSTPNSSRVLRPLLLLLVLALF
jgi:hypothetical protein